MGFYSRLFRRVFRGIRLIWSIIIFLVGILLIIAGFLGFFLPFVPGFILIIFGLFILATEFIWAKKLLEKTKDRVNRVKDSIMKRK